jgi:hypothetical protein
VDHDDERGDDAEADEPLDLSAAEFEAALAEVAAAALARGRDEGRAQLLAQARVVAAFDPAAARFVEALEALDATLKKARPFDEHKHHRDRGKFARTEGSHVDRPSRDTVVPAAAPPADHPRRTADRAAADRHRATAKEPPRPKHLDRVTKYKDVARRRRIVAALKAEAELATAIGGFNEPDSRPADVLHVTDAAGKPLTDPQKIRHALAEREAAVKSLTTGKVHFAGLTTHAVHATDRPLTPEWEDAMGEVLARPADAIEVKTLQTSPRHQVYLNPAAQKRKKRYAEKYAIGFAVVAVDRRRGKKNSGHAVYVLPHKDLAATGTVKLDAMHKVASMTDVLKAVRA